jgi:serine phosphatase RsbU (regulator of sigma subunit)
MGIVLGDVAGKGVPAALLVAKLSSEVRFSLVTEANPARAITSLNDQMIRGGLQDRFVTLAAMILDPAEHVVTIVNAGHMNPKLYRANAGELVEAITNEQSGLPLGVTPGFEYESVTVTLEPGDTVALYTDGVTDALNPGGEMFGYERVDQNLTPDDTALLDWSRPRRMGERLVEDVRKHANGRAQNDDIAVVCFGRLEVATGPTTGLARPATTPVKIPM